ncbi:MAG: hypothetical protein WBE99_00245, partial [Xanthobacteraceae bacterium]
MAAQIQTATNKHRHCKYRKEDIDASSERARKFRRRDKISNLGAADLPSARAGLAFVPTAPQSARDNCERGARSG